MATETNGFTWCWISPQQASGLRLDVVKIGEYLFPVVVDPSATANQVWALVDTGVEGPFGNEYTVKSLSTSQYLDSGDGKTAIVMKYVPNSPNQRWFLVPRSANEPDSNLVIRPVSSNQSCLTYAKKGAPLAIAPYNNSQAQYWLRTPTQPS